MRTITIATLAAIATLGSAAPIGAQSPSFLRTGETYQHLASLRGETRSDAAAEMTAAALASGGRHQGTVLMIVGAAGIITGLIIDEDIVTIAGAGVAGLGFYLYLDRGGRVEVGARHAWPDRSP